MFFCNLAPIEIFHNLSHCVKRCNMEGRHGLLGIFGCCIVLWLTVNQAQSAGIPQRVNAGEKPSTSFMSSIPALNVLSMMAKSHGNGWKTPQEINQTCPRLWSPTNEDFKRDKLTGVLGSLEEMSHLCNSDSKTAPLSAVCLGAVGISNYLVCFKLLFFLSRGNF